MLEMRRLSDYPYVENFHELSIIRKLLHFLYVYKLTSYKNTFKIMLINMRTAVHNVLLKAVKFQTLFNYKSFHPPSTLFPIFTKLGSLNRLQYSKLNSL